MDMREVLQHLIDYCTAPAPADTRDAHVLSFHLGASLHPSQPGDEFNYHGTAVISHATGGLNPFRLAGYGVMTAGAGVVVPAGPPPWSASAFRLAARTRSKRWSSLAA
jgi:hypothetical protein